MKIMPITLKTANEYVAQHHFRFVYKNSYFWLDDKYLDIHICERTKADAIKSLKQELSFLYKAYAVEKDENLTRGGRILKRKIIRLIKRTVNEDE